VSPRKLRYGLVCSWNLYSRTIRFVLDSQTRPLVALPLSLAATMSSQSGLDLGWFYDSEEQKHSSVKDFSSTEITRRPWKAFWPPRSGDNFDFWMRSEFPEVLSWQFDPDRPFDQPWRDWLRSLLMKVEAGSCRKRFTSTTMVTRGIYSLSTVTELTLQV